MDKKQSKTHKSSSLRFKIIRPNFELENFYTGYVVGFDEVGCGPWAGPVMAGAALILQDRFPSHLTEKINDSKKLKAETRERIFEQCQEFEGISCFTSVGECSVEEVDQLNVRQAATLAIERAAYALILPCDIQPQLGLVDGTLKPRLSYKTLSIPKGDTLSLSIALASIIAKVHRDKIMKNLAMIYPHYGWEKNVGYGTAFHQQALKLHGPCLHHRKSFAPIAKFYQAKF